MGSGLNDARSELLSVLTDKSYTVLVVEHEDRLTRFGVNYIKVLFNELGKWIELVNYIEHSKGDLIDDLATVISSFCSQLYGMRRAKGKTKKLISQIKGEANEAS
ncbi:MAG TPA: hypothetical protein V6D12_12395 [Candidatus Obscuribacterales bacterium]